MNKALAVLILFILCSSSVSLCFANGGGSTATLSLNPPALTVPKCTNFTININITSVAGLIYWSVSISFNATLVEALNITQGPFLKSFRPTTFSQKINNTGGYISASCQLCNKTIGVSGNGILANVTFHCKEVGDTNLTLYKTKLKDTSWALIPHTTNNGVVHQILPPPLPPPVGGEWVPINKLQLLAPWISLASTLGIAVFFVLFKRTKKRQD